MDIRIGKFRLTTDDLNFIVTQYKKPRTGKSKGVEVEVDKTFHSSLSTALENILKRQVRASKVTSIKELLNEIKQNKADLDKIFDIHFDVRPAKKEKAPEKDIKAPVKRMPRKVVDPKKKAPKMAKKKAVKKTTKK